MFAYQRVDAGRPGAQAASWAIVASAARTRSSCSAGLTLASTAAMRPASSTTNVVRSLPKYVRPYIDFSTQTP
jgi:hypothetical protein